MICPNCKKETVKITTVSDDDGRLFSFCALCPRPEKKVEFPALVTRRGRGRPRRVEGHDFERHALTQAEIEATRVLRPRMVTKDTPKSRDADSIDGILTGDRATVYVGGNLAAREKVAREKMANKLKTGNFRFISDNGLKVVGERIK